MTSPPSGWRSLVSIDSMLAEVPELTNTESLSQAIQTIVPRIHGNADHRQKWVVLLQMLDNKIKILAGKIPSHKRVFQAILGSIRRLYSYSHKCK